MTVLQVDKTTKWGDLESEEEESEEEEEEEEAEDDTESLADGIASIASGYNSSLPSGIETPEVIDLRKGKAGDWLSLCTGSSIWGFSVAGLLPAMHQDTAATCQVAFEQPRSL